MAVLDDIVLRTTKERAPFDCCQNGENLVFPQQEISDVVGSTRRERNVFWIFLRRQSFLVCTRRA